MAEKNRWIETVGHCGCIYPCHGKPLLRTEAGEVPLAAHDLPVFLQCSECGYTPLPKFQPKLVKRYLEYVLAQAKGGG